jgi:hypothetical protein
MSTWGHLIAPFKGTLRYVKAVVYDYGSDRTGSAVVKK